MAGSDLALPTRRTVVRASGSVGVVEPVTEHRSRGRRLQAGGRPDTELAKKAKVWADRTAVAQGLPATVNDQTIVSEVAVLLASGRVPVRSGPPDRLDALGIEPVPTTDRGMDHDPGQHRRNDRPLAGRVQVRPHRPQHTWLADQTVERRGA